MWPTSYPDRLQQWNHMRHSAQALPPGQSLLMVNDWWYEFPVTTRTIIWEEHQRWPDPWSLLGQERVCDLARALGMLYTVMMMQHPKLKESCLVQTDHDNLVLIDQGKYILNWAPGQLLNIQSQEIQVRRQLNSSVFNHVLR